MAKAKSTTPRGLILSAPSSGAGKTTVTLGLLAALKAAGDDVASAKSGPDYIDPGFHAAATGRPCITLDPWCATPDQLRARATEAHGPLLIVEGAMGLFDGAPSDTPLGHGSTADVAAALALPVILVIDAARRAQTAAAITHGLATFREGVSVAGVILNRIGSARHETMMRRAVETVAPVLGARNPRRDRHQSLRFRRHPRHCRADQQRRHTRAPAPARTAHRRRPR